MCVFPKCVFPKCAFPTCIFPTCIFPKCIFPKCIFPMCTFPKCIFPKFIFAKCTRLACLLSFVSLFSSNRFSSLRYHASGCHNFCWNSDGLMRPNRICKPKGPVSDFKRQASLSVWRWPQSGWDRPQNRLGQPKVVCNFLVHCCAPYIYTTESL